MSYIFFILSKLPQKLNYMNTRSSTLFNLLKSMNADECHTFEQNQKLLSSSTTAKTVIYFVYKNSSNFEDAEFTLSSKQLNNIEVIKANLKKDVIYFLTENSPVSSMKKLMLQFGEIELFFDRGLYEECSKLLNETEQFARKLDLTWALFPLNHFRYKLSNHFTQKNVDAIKQKLIKDNQENFNLLKFNLDTGALSEEIIGITSKNLNFKSKAWQKKMQAYKANSILKTRMDDPKLGVYSFLNLNIAKTSLAYTEGKFDEAFEYIYSSWLFLQKDWDFYLTYKRFETLTILVNLLSVGIESNQKEAVKYALKITERSISSGKITEPLYVCIYMRVKLQYVIKYEPNKIKSELYHHLPFLPLGFPKANLAYNRLYLLMVSVAYFKMEEFEEVKEIIYPIIQSYKQGDNRLDLRIESLVFYFSAFFCQVCHSPKLYNSFHSEFSVFYNSLRRDPLIKDRKITATLVKLFVSVSPKIKHHRLIEKIKQTKCLIIELNANDSKPLELYSLIDVENWLDRCLLRLEQ